MDTSLLILGSVGFLAFIGTKTTNAHFKTFIYLEVLLLSFAMGWLGWYSVDQTELIALEIWRYITYVIATGTILFYGGLWITGSLELEELDNGF